MSKQIGFDRLFDAQSFDAGTTQLVKYLNRITEEIDKAKDSASQFAKIMGAELKKEIAQLSSTSANLAKKMQEITQKMNDFKVATSNTKKVISDYEKENEKLRKELENLKKAQQDVTNTTKNKSQVMGQLRQSLLGAAAGGAILYRGIQMLGQQLTLSVQSTMAFEKAMKEVQAISRATSEELEILTRNANRLGATTEKTAVQVAETQKELAKLGFTATEIIVSTDAIVDLSTATGEDLASSATVAAATLRAFGLEASEMTRVVDVMAGSFVRSGLDLEKFRESMKLVAPIARATGVDIEVTTAALSKLADAGLSGSLAGTALRNLLSSMADPSEKLTQFLGSLNGELADGVKSSDDLVLAFRELKKSGIDLEQAVKMVDVRARPAFFTLVNQAEAVERLTIQYRYLKDEGSLLAEQMRDTLTNDVDILNSSFDSLRRNLVERASPAMREFVQDLTVLTEFTRFSIEAMSDLKDSITDTTVQRTWLQEFLAGILDGTQTIIDFATQAEAFSYLFGKIEESNNINKVEEQFTNLNLSVNDAITSFSKITESVTTFAEAQKVIDNFDVTEKFNENSQVIEILRSKYSDLSKSVTDNRDFLMLLQGEMIKNVDGSNSFINTLVEEEKQLEATIKMLKGFQETVGIGTEQTKQLQEAEKYLQVVRDLRLSQTKKVEEASKSLNSADNQYSDTLDKVAEKEQKAAEALKKREEAFKKFSKEWDDFQRQKAIDDAYNESREKRSFENFLKSRVIDEEKQKSLQEVIDKQTELTDVQKAQIKIDQDLQKISKDLFEEDQKLADRELENLKDHNEEVLRQEESLKQKRLKIAEEVAQGLSRITTFIFDNQQIQRENELNKIQEWEDEQVRLAGDNENAKLRIQEQADAQRAEIKKKQARANKAEALFQIAIDTAAAIVKSVLESPLTFGMPFAAVAAAVGAAQAAVVASRPLPQFAKGTNDSPEGFAEVGERGRELIRDGRTGQWSLTPDKSTVTYLSKHSQVIPNAQTEQILKADPNIMADNYLKNKIIEVKAPQIDYTKIGEAVGKELKNIPINMTNFDERGVTNYVVKRSVRLQRLNKRY